MLMRTQAASPLLASWRAGCAGNQECIQTLLLISIIREHHSSYFLLYLSCQWAQGYSCHLTSGAQRSKGRFSRKKDTVRIRMVNKKGVQKKQASDKRWTAQLVLMSPLSPARGHYTPVVSCVHDAYVSKLLELACVCSFTPPRFLLRCCYCQPYLSTLGLPLMIAINIQWVWDHPSLTRGPKSEDQKVDQF